MKSINVFLGGCLLGVIGTLMFNTPQTTNEFLGLIILTLIFGFLFIGTKE